MISKLATKMGVALRTLLYVCDGQLVLNAGFGTSKFSRFRDIALKRVQTTARVLQHQLRGDRAFLSKRIFSRIPAE
jgi:hypothetical protein